MEIDINDLSGEQIKELGTLAELKSKADRLYEAVIKYQKVPLYSNECTIWEDDHNREYLKHNGNKWMWIAEYLHQYYEISIDREEIFQVLKSSHEFAAQNVNTCYRNKYKEAIEYFTAYVTKLEDKHNA